MVVTFEIARNYLFDCQLLDKLFLQELGLFLQMGLLLLNKLVKQGNTLLLLLKLVFTLLLFFQDSLLK